MPLVRSVLEEFLRDNRDIMQYRQIIFHICQGTILCQFDDETKGTGKTIQGEITCTTPDSINVNAAITMAMTVTAAIAVCARTSNQWDLTV